MKDDDLLPHEWQSDRPKPKEPFFGPGLLWFIGVCITIVIFGLIKHYITDPMMLR